MSAPTLVPAASTPPHIYPLRMVLRHEGDGAGADGRTLYGLAVPFDVELDVSDFWDDYTEVFRKGSFAKTIRDRSHALPLLVHHNHRGLPIGAATELAEEDDGLHAAFHLSATREADDVLALLADDAISGLSIGFEPVTHTETKGPNRTPPSSRDLHERTEVKLREVSLCNFPAFVDAGVHGVRASQDRHPSLAALAAERDRGMSAVGAWRDRWGRVSRR